MHLTVFTGKHKHYLKAIQNRILELTHRAGMRPFSIYVSEFPKSGGTWLTEIVQDIGQTQEASTRYSRGHVVHQHWRHQKQFRPAIYVVRDGRDVVVSYFFHHVRALRMKTALSNRIHTYFNDIFGTGYDVDDIQANLPRFIESLSVRPHGGTLRRRRDRKFLSWPEHVRDWVGREGVFVVRYEELLADTPSQIRRIARHLEIEVGADEAMLIASRNSFESRTGRKPGEEDRLSFYRRGVAGDWRNHFTREAAYQFVKYAGDVLIELGYEPDSSWAIGIRDDPYHHHS